ncbi:MAG: hypothetical protein WCI22_01210, partial [Actinomycetota bacterium]
MQRSWIIGISVAFVVGSAGASYAALATHDPIAPTTAQAQAPATGLSTYRIGDAGSITLSWANGLITVVSTTAGSGWTFVGATDAAAHVQAQFTDGTQTITFTADLVNGQIAVSLSTTNDVTTDSSS